MTRIEITLLSAMVAVSAGCDSSAPAGPSTSTAAQPVIVSDAIAEPQASATVAYVSVSPGGFSGATGVTIESREGSILPVVPVDGGFDPVAVPAAEGDTLEIRATLAGGGTIARRTAVPARRRPRVVRTEPARGRRDVAINSVIGVVFSEPMDPATVRDSTIRLLKDGVAVRGTLQAASGSNVGIEFAPAEPLDLAATYQLVLDGSLRDLSGDPLESTDPVEFTTFGDGGTAPLTVITRTTGDADPDGYDLRVDGRVAIHLQPTDSVDLAGVAAGGHHVLLSDISAGCIVKGGVFREIQVTTAAIARVEFDIACPVLGTVQVTTTGADADGDGYRVLINGGFSRDVQPNGTFPLSGLSYGLNVIELTGIRGNCGDAQSARRFITVEFGDVDAEASFEVRCAADFLPEGTIAFASTANSSASGPTAIVVANADGSGRLQLTDDQTRNVQPVWSPDGGRIAFLRELQSGDDLYLVDADGGNLVRRVAGFFQFVNSVAWLPDGRIMLKGTTVPGEDPALFAVDPDGSGPPVPVLSGFGLVAWSPSGTQFVLLDGSTLGIFDGSGIFQRQLEAGVNSVYWWGPYWSSDEDTFALVACREALVQMDPATELGYCTSYLLDFVVADGIGRSFMPLVEPITSPAWSRDGSTIAFTRCGGGACRGIGYMRADGSGSSVTISDGFDPAWKP
jgi:hypothetical protein